MRDQYRKGLVSVIIPTYKRNQMITRAVMSVLNQTYSELELLVVNDNEEGDSYSIELYKMLGTIQDDRLHIVKQDKHINGAAARNAGIREARGEYISFLDDDDFWDTKKLEYQVKELSLCDVSFGAVACLMRIYKSGRLVSASMPYRDGYILVDILDRKTSMGTGSLLIRRSALDETGYFDESLLRHQDLQLFARLTQKYKIKLQRIILHNREIGDSQNRPTIDSIETIKMKYFRSIKDIMDSLPQRKQRIIHVMHEFECAYLFLRNKKIKRGMGIIIRVVSMPETLYLANHRIIKRMVSKLFRNTINHRYSRI